MGELDDRVFEWAAVLDDATYYELLGVLEIADTAGVKDAFREFARKFHPDRHRGAAPEVREAVERVWRRAAEAYRVLADPELRTRYDLALATGHLRLDGDEIPRGPPPIPPGVRALPDLCRTPAARYRAQYAEDALGRGDLRSARKELKAALELEGAPNPELRERLEAVELALFAAGAL